MNRLTSLLSCGQQQPIQIVEKIILTTAIIVFSVLGILAATHVLPFSVGTGIGIASSFVTAVVVLYRLYKAQPEEDRNQKNSMGNQTQGNETQDQYLELNIDAKTLISFQEIEELPEERQLVSLQLDQLIQLIDKEAPDVKLCEHPNGTCALYLKDEPLSYYNSFKKEDLRKKCVSFLKDVYVLRRHLDPQDCILSFESLQEIRTEHILHTASNQMLRKIVRAQLAPVDGDLFISEGRGRFVFYYYYTSQETASVYKDTLVCHRADFESVIKLYRQKGVKAIYNITKNPIYRIAKAANWENDAEFKAHLQHLYFTEIH